MKEFLDAIKKSSVNFKDIKGTVKIIGHMDSDGLCSSAIFVKMLTRMGVKFSLTNVRQLDESVLDEAYREFFSSIVFLGLGSASLNKIEEKFKGKDIFVLDDHFMNDYDGRINLLNPRKCGLNQNISSSAIAYLFAKAVNLDNIDLAHIAVIGGIRKDNLKSELNNFILEDAIDNGLIELRVGASALNSHNMPLDKVLESSIDPYIPGITGNKDGARKFLDGLGMKFKENGRYRRILDLTKEDIFELLTAVSLIRLGSDTSNDVLCDIFLLGNEENDSMIKDAKEFSSMLNACGMLFKPGIGIAACLGDKIAKEEAIEIYTNYKHEIIDSLSWFYENKNKILVNSRYIVINAQDNIKDNLIGVLCSIIARSNLYDAGSLVFGIAHTVDNNLKISARCVNPCRINLRDVVERIVKKVGGACGGQKYAAGAIIEQEKETEFLDAINDILHSITIEMV